MLAMLAAVTALAVPLSSRPPERMSLGHVAVGVPYAWDLRPSVGPSRTPRFEVVDPQRPSRRLELLELRLDPSRPEQLDAASIQLADVLRQGFPLLTGVRLDPDIEPAVREINGLPVASFVGTYQMPGRPGRSTAGALGRGVPPVQGLIACAFVTSPEPGVYVALVMRDRVFGFEREDQALARHWRVFEQIVQRLERVAITEAAEPGR